MTTKNEPIWLNLLGFRSIRVTFQGDDPALFYRDPLSAILADWTSRELAFFIQTRDESQTSVFETFPGF